MENNIRNILLSSRLPAEGSAGQPEGKRGVLPRLIKSDPGIKSDDRGSKMSHNG